MALGEDITGEQFLLGLNKLSMVKLFKAHLFGGLVLFMENDRYGKVSMKVPKVDILIYYCKRITQFNKVRPTFKPIGKYFSQFLALISFLGKIIF